MSTYVHYTHLNPPDPADSRELIERHNTHHLYTCIIKYINIILRKEHMKFKKPLKDIMDGFKHYTIHEDEYRQLSRKDKDFLDGYQNIEFYENGMKNGKRIDKVKEFKRVVKEMVKIRDKNLGEQSNLECMHIDLLVELLRKMMLTDVRKLHFEKLL